MSSQTIRKISIRSSVFFALFALILLNWTVRRTEGRVDAPNTYTTQCSNCGFTSCMDKNVFDSIQLMRMHPEQFSDLYGGRARPMPHHCSGCGMLQRDANLAISPETGERFVMMGSIRDESALAERIADASPSTSF